jgi:hypothetical protein
MEEQERMDKNMSAGRIKNKTEEPEIGFDSYSDQYTTPLDKMIERVNKEPKPKEIYRGIQERSLGTFFGNPKCGKTMALEGLALSLAAGVPSYLGSPLDGKRHKVLFLSLEEHYTARTERNKKQIAKLTPQYGTDWVSNYIVANENLPKYLTSDEDFYIVYEVIMETGADFVIIDSLGHCCERRIEESEEAKKTMKRLRGLQEATGTTIALAHHTPKQGENPLSIESVAGSRVIAQELDFMIGMKRTANGIHYMKDVAFRHFPCNSDIVRTFSIDEHCWININGEQSEEAIYARTDARKDDGNKIKLLEFIKYNREAGFISTTAAMIGQKFIDTQEMSRPTVFEHLRKLIEEGSVYKVAKGEYNPVD